MIQASWQETTQPWWVTLQEQFTLNNFENLHKKGQYYYPTFIRFKGESFKLSRWQKPTKFLQNWLDFMTGIAHNMDNNDSRIKSHYLSKTFADRGSFLQRKNQYLMLRYKSVQKAIKKILSVKKFMIGWLFKYTKLNSEALLWEQKQNAQNYRFPPINASPFRNKCFACNTKNQRCNYKLKFSFIL